MKPKEAIRWIEAILEDTLEPNDERDAGRIEAVELAIAVLKMYRSSSPAWARIEQARLNQVSHR